MSVMMLPDGVDTLVTTTEAATMAGVSVSAVSNWATRGYTRPDGTATHLQPAGLTEQGRPLYRVLDVAKAEQATKRRARRKR